MNQPEYMFMLFPPEKRSISETFFYKTALFASLDLSETRKALLDDYKYKVNYTLLLTDLEKEILTNMVYNRNDNVIMPIWGQAILYKTAQSSSDKIYFDTSTMDVEVDQTMLVFTPASFEPKHMVQITEIAADSITVSETVTIGAGDIVAPARLGILSKNTSFDTTHGELKKVSISFEEY